jgi:uncharacterized HAD superfamily protein
MKIAIDVDEVLAEQLDSLVKFYEEETGQYVSKEEFFSYNWADVWKISLEEAIEWDRKFKESPYFENISVVEGAKEAIQKLKDEHEIYVVTSRPIEFKQKTVEWLWNHFGIDESRIFLSGDFHRTQGKTKEQICSDLGISVIIDDRGDFGLNYARVGMKVLMPDKPWNQEFEHENLIRCDGWEGILDCIGGMANGK